jgi:hypothetical protein
VALLVIWADRRFRLGHGRAFALYVAAYTVGRFWIEHMRVDYAHHILGMRLNDWTAIVVFIGAVVYFVLSARRRPGREEVVEPGIEPAPAGPDSAGPDSAGTDGAGTDDAGHTDLEKSAGPTEPGEPGPAEPADGASSEPAGESASESAAEQSAEPAEPTAEPEAGGEQQSHTAGKHR